MEAIKKKMQSMKVEKDNLMDRCDNCEQAARDAKIRLEKTEEEATELSNKAKTLEVEVDVFGEKLSQSEMKQKAKEAQVMAAEAEFNRLNRRVQELEEDLENNQVCARQPEVGQGSDDRGRQRQDEEGAGEPGGGRREEAGQAGRGVEGGAKAG
jgi:chromosome segregation ATPase